jgi:hypothetical protein
MMRASVRVESEASLRPGEAILCVIEGVARAKDFRVRPPSHEAISEVTADELVEYVSATVQHRLSARAMGL